MALSWNEIRERAVKFAKEWENTTNEEADAKPFLDAFFDVFGVSRKKIGTFEHRIKKLSEADGYIDLLWKGTILIEMKSRGKNLDKAFQQALDYTHGLKQFELPQYILVCDFEIFRVYDTEEQTTVEFKLKDLYKNVQSLGLVAGYSKKTFQDQDDANIEAAELMGKLHDRLEEIGYDGHNLEVYLVRLLFCLFAEDTTIFDRQQFQDYIEQRTAEDGSDLAAKIQELFQVLNTPREKRFKNLDEDLLAFKYINGKLFDEILPMASFDSKMRNALLNACRKDWSGISPAIFGSMFQSVMNPKERRNLGAHYTSEKNIMKVIKPLFLDELYLEFEKVHEDINKLSRFHNKIADLRFLDPACGCGNFLIITYREIRRLELKVLLELQKLNRRIHQMEFLDISLFFKVNVDRFYGIEYEEFPARIAEVAMWLIDHQMNMEANVKTGEQLLRIPLVKSAKIVHGDAMEIDWGTLRKAEEITINAEQLNYKIVTEPISEYGTVNVYTKNAQEIEITSDFPPYYGKEKIQYDYIIGNPPFIGSKIMSQYQRNQIINEFGNTSGSGNLDYVSGWYIKAAKYIQNSKTKVAFVSTNSIVQGEQTAILWGQMLNKYNVKINFAHRTFKWSNEAKGNAAVYCVIIGFANFDNNNKTIYEYDDIKGEAHSIQVKNINPYLVDAKDIFIEKRRKPICNVPEISFGSMPNDGGYLLLDDNEKELLCAKDKIIEKYIRPLISAKEYLNNGKRWCLWMADNYDLNDLDKSSELKSRIMNVMKHRSESTREATKNLAKSPMLFGEIRQPKTDYILIPRVSSEKRSLIAMSLISSENIVSDTCLAIENATLYHLGILQSSMHMAWIKSVCGRLESRFRYSNEIVFNNFPWPDTISEKQKERIEEKMQVVLNIRNEIKDTPLGKLYDFGKTPINLVKAHIELDKAVDAAYSKQKFNTETLRLEFLFELYEKNTADLFSKEKTKKLKK